jgi:cell division septal protein FtsQ
MAAPKRPWAWRNILRTLGLLAGVSLVVWIAFFSGWLNVRAVTLKGSNTVSEEQLKETVDTYFDKIPLQRNILFTDVRELDATLRKAYPTFSKVNIYRTIFLTLQVQVTETAPALIWKTGGQNWLIGADGRILRQASAKDSVKGSVTDTAQLSVEAGKKVADAGFISFVLEAYKTAGEQQLTIANVTINDTTQEAIFILDNGITVKTDTTGSAKAQMEAAKKTFTSATETKKPVTQYIDTRVSGRTYYK